VLVNPVTSFNCVILAAMIKESPRIRLRPVCHGEKMVTDPHCGLCGQRFVDEFTGATLRRNRSVLNVMETAVFTHSSPLKKHAQPNVAKLSAVFLSSALPCYSLLFSC
jgi:hypothetical protein